MKNYPHFLEQNCTLTLRESLKEYREFLGSTLVDNEGESEGSRWLFDHDVTHIIFGTIPFQLRGESLTDGWTLGGTTTTIKKYKEFSDKYVSVKTVLNSYKKWYKNRFWIYFKILRVLPLVALAFYRGKRMKKKWDWFDPQPYLDNRVVDIREEFGIKIISPHDKREERLKEKVRQKNKKV